MNEFELEPGEKIQRTIRKHWLILVGYAIPYAVLAWLPTWFVSYISTSTFGADHAFAADLSFGNPWVRFVVGIWWLFVWMGFFSHVTRYFLNQWFITTTRIIEVAQYGFFRREVSSMLLLHVQDVKTDITGFFHTLFNFGTVEVENAGAEENFVMSGLNDPRGVRDLIMREISDLHLDGAKPV